MGVMNTVCLFLVTTLAFGTSLSSASCEEDLMNCVGIIQSMPGATDLVTVCTMRRTAKACIDDVKSKCHELGMIKVLEDSFAQLDSACGDYDDDDENDDDDDHNDDASCDMIDLVACAPRNVATKEERCRAVPDFLKCVEPFRSCTHLKPTISQFDEMIESLNCPTEIPGYRNCEMSDLVACAPRNVGTKEDQCRAVPDFLKCVEPFRSCRHLKPTISKFDEMLESLNCPTGGKDGRLNCQVELQKCVKMMNPIVEMASSGDIAGLCKIAGSVRSCFETVINKCPDLPDLNAILTGMDNYNSMCKDINGANDNNCNIGDLSACFQDVIGKNPREHHCKVVPEFLKCVEPFRKCQQETIKGALDKYDEIMREQECPTDDNFNCQGELQKCVMELGPINEMTSSGDMASVCKKAGPIHSCFETVINKCPDLPHLDSIMTGWEQFSSKCKEINGGNDNNCHFGVLANCFQDAKGKNPGEHHCKVVPEYLKCVEPFRKCEQDIIKLALDKYDELMSAQKCSSDDNCEVAKLAACAPAGIGSKSVEEQCKAAPGFMNCVEPFRQCKQETIQQIIGQFDSVIGELDCSGITGSDDGNCEVAKLAACVPPGIASEPVEDQCKAAPGFKKCVEPFRQCKQETIQQIIGQFDSVIGSLVCSDDICYLKKLAVCSPPGISDKPKEEQCKAAPDFLKCVEPFRKCPGTIKLVIVKIDKIMEQLNCNSGQNFNCFEGRQKCMKQLHQMQEKLSSGDQAELCRLMEPANTCLTNQVSNECPGSAVDKKAMEPLVDLCETIGGGDNCTLAKLATCVPPGIETKSKEDQCKAAPDFMKCVGPFRHCKHDNILDAVNRFDRIVRDLNCQEDGLICDLRKLAACSPPGIGRKPKEEQCKAAPDFMECVEPFRKCTNLKQAFKKIDQIVGRLDCDAKDGNDAKPKPACTVEKMSRCMRDARSSSTTSDEAAICRSLNETNVCLRALLPSCDGEMRETVGLALAQFTRAGTLCNSCPKQESHSSLCNMESIYLCDGKNKKISHSTDHSYYCRDLARQVLCLQPIADNCVGRMKRVATQLVGELKHRNVTYKCSLSEEGTTRAPTSPVPSGPYFDAALTTVTATEGSNVILPCAVYQIDQYKVTWTDTYSTVLSYEDRRVIADKRLSVGRPYSRDWNLHIRDVRMSDQGRYTCQVNTSPASFKIVNLLVKARDTTPQ